MACLRGCFAHFMAYLGLFCGPFLWPVCGQLCGLIWDGYGLFRGCLWPDLWLVYGTELRKCLG